MTRAASRSWDRRAAQRVPVRLSPIAIAVHTSAAAPALALMAALVLANIAARDRSWEHEWVWATYQYAFVTVLFGPLVAGIAAWDGSRLARARSLLGTTERTFRALVLGWVGVVTWALLTYLGGLAVVAALVRASGTPGWPSAAALLAPVPGAFLLMAEAAAGLAVGWWLRHPLAAPAAVIGCFVTTLWLYTAGPGELVVVGGATSSLVNLTPRVSLQALQILWFASATLGFLVAAARLTGWGRRRGGWALPAASCLCALVVVPLLHQGETFLVATADREVCTGSAPAVCVAPGYATHAAATRAALLPYLRALSRVGVAIPTTFRQNTAPGQGSVGPIESGLILGDRGRAGFAVLAAYVSKSCPIDASPALQAQYSGLAYWLFATVDGQRNPDPTVPAVVTGPASPGQARWVRAAVRALATCAP